MDVPAYSPSLRQPRGKLWEGQLALPFQVFHLKYFTLLGLLMLQPFFTAQQPLKGTENCQYRVFPPRCNQLSQTEILLFGVQVKSVT